jgi:hypothetical protein
VAVHLVPVCSYVAFLTATGAQRTRLIPVMVPSGRAPCSCCSRAIAPTR